MILYQWVCALRAGDEHVATWRGSAPDQGEAEALGLALAKTAWRLRTGHPIEDLEPSAVKVSGPQGEPMGGVITLERAAMNAIDVMPRHGVEIGPMRKNALGLAIIRLACAGGLPRHSRLEAPLDATMVVPDVKTGKAKEEVHRPEVNAGDATGFSGALPIALPLKAALLSITVPCAKQNRQWVTVDIGDSATLRAAQWHEFERTRRADAELVSGHMRQLDLEREADAVAAMA